MGYRFSVEPPLAVMATQFAHQSVLLFRLDSFRNYFRAAITQMQKDISNQPVQCPVRSGRMHHSHIELYRVGPQFGKRGEIRKAGSKIIDREGHAR